MLLTIANISTHHILLLLYYDLEYILYGFKNKLCDRRPSTLYRENKSSRIVTS